MKRNFKMISFLIFILIINLTTYGWETSDIKNELTVLVKDFLADNENISALVTEIVRNGLCSAPFLRIIDEGESLYVLEGSIEEINDGLIVTYTLIDKALHRIELAGSKTVRKTNIEQDCVSLSFEINNVFLSIYAGSTINAIEELIKSGYLEEAQKRFDSFASRYSKDPAVTEIRKKISKELSMQWLKRAYDGIKNAEKEHDEELLNLINQIKVSFEAALLFLPEDDSYNRIRNEISQQLAGSVELLYARGVKEIQNKYIRNMKQYLSSGYPEYAVDLFNNYKKMYGIQLTTETMKTLNKISLQRYSEKLAKMALNCLKDDNLNDALDYSVKALGIEYNNKIAMEAYEKISSQYEKIRAQNIVLNTQSYNTEKPIKLKWFVSSGLGFSSNSGDDFTFPVKNSIPFCEIQLQRVLLINNSYRLSLGLNVYYGYSEGITSFYGMQGTNKTTITGMAFSTEVSKNISIGNLSFAPGLVFGLGFQYYDWYSTIAQNKILNNYTIAPQLSAGCILCFPYNDYIEYELQLSPYLEYIFNYGFSTGINILLKGSLLF
ncbi:MAG TPA: hypothetical protein PLB48_07865 [Treponema sp.]|nr:hypothetical protein [Treponema sp.]HRS04366.1 hypothetical protein [Treponema sp.]HRU28775.1 hypothetical protein [Treponema sp.]